MKEERMTILKMLENGTINAEEAKELLATLQRDSSTKELFDKAGNLLNRLAKKAEKLEPKVKETAEKASQKASIVMEDAKTYFEKLRQKREGDNYVWEDDEIFDEDFEEEEVVSMQEEEKETKETEETSECVEKADIHMKNLESYMNTVEMQMNQLDDAEAFLKGAFGNPDDIEWMEEEEGETKENTDAKEQEKNKKEEA